MTKRLSHLTIMVGLQLAWLSTPCARADATWTALAAQPGQVRIDGALREWPQRSLQTITDAAGGALSLTLAYDEESLFVAARVEDDSVVRNKRASERDDAIVLQLAMPAANGRQAVCEIWLHPGVPGKQAAVARMMPGGNQQRIEIVEGPLEKGVGYALEARIPWKIWFPSENRHFARVGIRLHDVDAGGKRSNKGLRMRPLVLEGSPVVALESFLQHQDLQATKPLLDTFANVGGDKRVERILVVGSFVVVVSADAPLRYASLPVTAGAEVLDAQLAPLIAYQQSALLVRTRRARDQGSMDLLQVYRLDGDPQVVLSVELRKEIGSGYVEAEYSIAKGKKAASALVVETGKAQEISSSSLRESPAPGVEALLTPWGPTARSRYVWDGSRFVPTHEPNPDYKAEGPAAASTSKVAGSSPSRGASDAPQTLIPPTEAALLEAFKKSRGMRASLRPSHVERINVAEDNRRESMLIVDHDLVVLGEGFRGGTGFFYFTLPCHSAADIRHVFTADVSGDGRREIFVRIIEHIGDVTRHVLHGYSFEGGQFSPILAVEVYRSLADQVIANRVKVERRGTYYGLRIEPGVVRGWDADSYPFTESADDTCLPLLLPFRDSMSRYRYSGGQLVANR